MRMMLPALGALAVLSACHKKPELTPVQVAQQDLTQFQAEVRKIVKDSARAESLVAMTNEFQAIVATTAQGDSVAHARIDALTRDYGSTRGQFDSVFSAVMSKRRLALSQVALLRARMAAVATPAEWEQLKSARLKLSENEINALEF